MACTVEFWIDEADLDLTINLYPITGDDGIANGSGDTASPVSGKPGFYRALIGEALDGYYVARILDQDDILVAGGVVLVGDGGTYLVKRDITKEEIGDEILTRQITESYAANGVAPTLSEAVMAIHQMLMAFIISGTSLTVKKLDGSTNAFVVTLNDATSPTGATRS